MKMFFGILFFSLLAFSQQYLEKQDSNIVNLLKNSGFENGVSQYTGVSGTTTVISLNTNPNDVLQDTATAVFQPVSGTEVLATKLYVPRGLQGRDCQAQVIYKTDEATNFVTFAVVDSASATIASVVLDTAATPELITLDFVCGTNSLQIQMIASGTVSDPYYLDGLHLGSAYGSGSGAITNVTGTTPITITGTVSAPNVTLDLSGVVSGTYTKFGVNAFGLVTSGTSLVDLDIPALDFSKITTGIVPIAQGGTGLSAVGASNTVLTSNGTGLVYTVIGGGTGTVSSVTGTAPIVITGTASEPNVTLTSGGVTSGTYTKVGVNEFGLISSGTSLVESDIPSLQTTKITSGVFGIARGGTGLGSVGASGTVLTSNGTDLVYAASTGGSGVVESVSATSPLSITGTVSNPIVTFSGTLPVSNGGTGLTATGASGSVLTSNASGTAEWLQPEQKENINFLTNASFETGNLTGWTSTGTAATVSAYSNPIKGNAFVSLFSSGTSSLCQVAAIPSGNAGQTIEVGGFYKYLSNSGLPPVSYPIRVSATLNTGAVVSQTFLYEASAVDTQLYRPVPTMFIGTTSQTTTATLCAEAPNGTTVTGAFAGEGLPWFDRMYLGTVKSLINGAIVEGESACVGVTEQGFTGTNASYVCSRVGDKLKIRGFFRVGSPTASLAAINMPTGLNIDVSKQGITATQIFGRWVRGIDGTSTTMASNTIGPRFMFVKNTDKTKVYFATITNAVGGASPSSLLQDIAGSSITATNDQISFELEVPIEGWIGSGTTYNSTCPNDIACNNEFSVDINSAGALTNITPTGWITSCPSTAPYSCLFAANVFRSQPQCRIQITGSSAIGNAVTTRQAAGVSYTLYNSGGAGTADAVTLFCKKSNSDYILKNEIKGYMNQTMQTGGLYQYKFVSVTFGGASEVTQCSATPCTIYRQSGEISSVSRASSGVFALNFVAGTFTVAPTCFFTTNATTSRGMMVSVVSRTNLVYNFITREDSNLAQDVYGDAVCFGY